MVENRVPNQGQQAAISEIDRRIMQIGQETNSRNLIRKIAQERNSGAILNIDTVGKAGKDLNDPNISPADKRSAERVLVFHQALDPRSRERVENGEANIMIDFVGKVVERPRSNPEPKK